MAVSIEGQQGCREFGSVCQPAMLSVPHCKVLSCDDCLTAGEVGHLKLLRRDRLAALSLSTDLRSVVNACVIVNVWAVVER